MLIECSDSPAYSEKIKMYPENKMILFLASLTLMDLIAVVKAFL